MPGSTLPIFAELAERAGVDCLVLACKGDRLSTFLAYIPALSGLVTTFD